MEFFDDCQSFLAAKKDYESYLINRVSKFSKIVLFGIGESALFALEIFKDNGITIDAIYDEDETKNNTYFEDVLITLPNYHSENTAVIVTCSFYKNIRNNFLKFDKDIDKRLFLFDGYFRQNYDLSYYEKNKDKIIKAYDALEDQKSKLVYNTVLKYRYIRDPRLLLNIVDPPEDGYFDKIALDKFKPGVIIDAGAYKGNFVKQLSEKIDVKDSIFYLFEPNKFFASKIGDYLKDYNNFKIFNCALCDKNGQMKFTLMNTSTSHILNDKYSAYKISSDEIVDVDAYCLDNIIADEPVSLIKIDIEGSEQAFLKGAKNTIIKNKPILLLSAYHKVNDLWELICFLNDLNLGYKFYMRHYTMCVAKTILYCVIDDEKIIDVKN